MPRGLWWAPLVALTLVAGVLVFRLGWKQAHLSETDAISHSAARYVMQTGGEAKVTDCVGRPGGQDGIWLILRCVAPGDGAVTRFSVAWFGRLIGERENGSAEPQT
tara:strand:- start:789 stop:1106 length:318 start_codon:yes stop_codon:yes gene_type:complete